MLTAIEARRLQEESFTLRGRVIDAIRKVATKNESEVVITNLNLSSEVARELENKGYFVRGNVISWSKTDAVEVVDTIVLEEPLSSGKEVVSTDDVK